MRWLIRRDTRRARWLILLLRIRVLRYGDDFAETMTASLALVYGVVLLFPGDTTGHAIAWRVLRELCGGDIGLGLLFAVLAVFLWLAALRLVGDVLRQLAFVIAFAVWVGMAVGFFAGYPSSLGPYLSILYALTAWMAYMRADR